MFDEHEARDVGHDVAFPSSYENGNGRMVSSGAGLTKREYFAAKFLQAIIPGNYENAILLAANAKRAVEYADALLKELGKHQ